MSVATELQSYLQQQGVDTEDPWYRMPLFGRRVPIFKLQGRLKRALTAHDVHHLVTGYDTGFAGESELCAWELATGGCHTYGLFWLDRLLFMPIALVYAPIRFVRAFWRGLGQRNMFGADTDKLLQMDVDSVRRQIGIV